MLIAAVDQGALVLQRRPDTVIKLTAIGPDKFRGSIGTVTFIRNASGVGRGTERRTRIASGICASRRSN